MTLYTTTNIQIIHRIYLEIYRSPLVKETQTLLQIKRYSTATSQYVNNSWKNSGFNNNLIHRQSQHSNSYIQEKQKEPKPKIIWFNPPFSTNVKTNIGKIFFKLLHKHFPKTNKLYKLFSKNSVKNVYCFWNFLRIVKMSCFSICLAKYFYGCITKYFI